MPKEAKRSFIWNFFTNASEGFATCNMCKNKVSYKSSISNLKKHLLRKHPSVKPKDYESQDPAPTNRLAPPSQPPLATPPAPTSTAGPSLNLIGTAGPSRTNWTTASQGQGKITGFMRKNITGTEKKKIMDSFMKLFYKDLQPFSITENEGFREFVHNLNPNFVIPDRKTVSKSYMPALYETCFKNVSDVLLTVKSICLTTDAWTSINNESFIAVTGHFLDDSFNYQKVLLKCCVTTERHTSDNLAEDLQRVIIQWNLEGKVSLVVTDNASNIVSAIKDKLKLKHLGCFAHTINLIVKKAFASTSAANALIIRVRTLVGHFKRSTVAMNKLIKMQENLEIKPPKKIVQDVCTRWNSTYYMVERFLQLQEAIISVMGSLDISASEQLNSDEWALLGDIKRVLSPFEQATKNACADRYMSASTIIPITTGLKYKLQEKNLVSQRTAQSFLTALEIGIEERLDNLECSKTLSAATFLDPRFKTQAFRSQVSAEAAKQIIISCVAEEIQKKLNAAAHTPPPLPLAMEASIFSFLKNNKVSQKTTSARAKAIIEVDRYLDEEFLNEDGDPTSWWKENRHNFPNICNLLQSKFCAVATSVPCERLFSKASNVYGERRTRMKSKTVSEILFLSENANFL